MVARKNDLTTAGKAKIWTEKEDNKNSKDVTDFRCVDKGQGTNWRPHPKFKDGKQEKTSQRSPKGSLRNLRDGAGIQTKDLAGYHRPMLGRVVFAAVWRRW